MIVTGSDIPTAQEVGPNPVLTLDRAIIEHSPERTADELIKNLPLAHRHDLFHDFRGEHQEGDRAAVDFVRFRRSFTSPRRRVLEIELSSACPRKFRPLARKLCAGGEGDFAGGSSQTVERLTSDYLGLDHRGFLQEGMFADVLVFDPATIADHATFEKPHQYATGMKHVFVNGTQVIKDGEHTDAKPGRALAGPGKLRN